MINSYKKETERGEYMRKVGRKKRKNGQRVLFFCFLFLIIVYSREIQVSAEENKASLNLEIENRILTKKSLDKRKIQTMGFVFEIIPEEPQCPLPAVKEVKITGEGKAVFDTIYFTEAGNYSYRIRQKTTEQKNWKLDTREYKVKVSVKNREKNQYLLTVYGFQDGSEAKTDAFRFENFYEGVDKGDDSSKSELSHYVKTGDKTSGNLEILLLTGAGIVIIGILSKRQKKE